MSHQVSRTRWIVWIALALVLVMTTNRPTLEAAAGKGGVNIAFDGLVLTGTYSVVAGQPTGAAHFGNGLVGSYPEASCIPSVVHATNDGKNATDINFTITYDYKHSGNPTNAVGIEALQAIALVSAGDPNTNVDNLNEVLFLGTALTTVTQFPGTNGMQNATVSGPYSGLTGMSPVTADDTTRHENVVLPNVPASSAVYVLFCAKLGPDAAAFPGASMSVNADPGSGGGGGGLHVNPGELLILPTLTVQKVVSGGTAKPDQWGFRISPAINGVTDFPIPAGQDSVTISNISSDGTYTISELTGPSGYAFSSGSGTGCSFANGEATVTLAAGAVAQVVSCSFTNSVVAPKLTVVKQVVNDNGGTLQVADVPLFVDGNPATSGAQTTLTPGVHVVSETAQIGYQATFSGDCDSEGNVSLNPGDVKTCTITNDDQRAQLTVVKNVINDNGGTRVPGDFTLNVQAAHATPTTFSGSSSGTVVTLDAGSYGVDEMELPGYAKSLSLECSGTLAPGETKTCTVTNDDQPAQLTVIKHVVNDNGGKASADFFQLMVTGQNATPSSFVGNETGTVVALNAGAYSVDEAVSEGYVKNIGANCAGTMGNGESKTCTITNDDVAPAPADSGTLIVIKKVVNDDGGTLSSSNFTIHVNGPSATPSGFTGQDDPGTSVILGTGEYFVTEDAVNGYTQSFSGDCAGILAKDVTKTCTITDDDQPGRLTVTKHVVNDNGGVKTAANFQLQVTSFKANPAAFAGSEEGTIVSLAAGEYSVDELVSVGYQKTLGTGCSGTIDLGESKTCLVTNDDVAAPPIVGGGGEETPTGTLTVITSIINDNGGTKTLADYTVTINASNPSPGSFHGSVSGTVVIMDAAAYDVVGSEPAGYVENYSADCSGTMPASGAKTCTIVLDDVGSGSTSSTTSTTPTTPPPTTSGGGGGGGGGGGLPATSGGGAHGFLSDLLATQTPAPTPRVLGAEDINEAAGGCPVTESEALTITPNVETLTTNVGLTRQRSMEDFYGTTLVPRVTPPELTGDPRVAVTNFTTYGTQRTYRLGAGERAGVVNSFRAVYGRVPLSDCDWQNAVRIASYRLPHDLSATRESSSESLFRKIYDRAPQRMDSTENSSILMMAYGLRPLNRDLEAERKMIPLYRHIFGKIPQTATEWDALRAMAYVPLKK